MTRVDLPWTTARGQERIVFGCEQLGGYEWGNVEPQAVQDAVRMAIESGVRIFDTADCYGRGESERRLGETLASARTRVAIATKFGVRFDSAQRTYYDSSPAYAREALHSSLRRLGTDYVDLFQVHYWDGRTPLEETLDALERLRESGKIRAYGLTNHLPPTCDQSRHSGLISVSLELSLANRERELTAKRVQAQGLLFLAYGVLGQGVLAGRYGAGHVFGIDDRRRRAEYSNFQGERLLRNLHIVEVLREHSRQLGVPVPQLAIAWVLERLPGSFALVGLKSTRQLEDACQAANVRLPVETLAALDEASQP